MTVRKMPRGIMLIDILVGIAVIGIVFFGLFGAFQLSVGVVTRAKGAAVASALLNSEMEHVRSLPYAQVGVTGATPGGILSASSEEEQNGTRYTVERTVRYVDDPADGTGASDQDANADDYKAVLITVSWQTSIGERAVSAESYVVPPG